MGRRRKVERNYLVFFSIFLVNRECRKVGRGGKVGRGERKGKIGGGGGEGGRQMCV